MTRWLSAFCLALAAIMLAYPLAAQPAVYAPGGIAIRGYDPVAYLTEEKAVRGSATNSFVWNGATWWFANGQNRAAFAANPERMAPQFGEYDGLGVSAGRAEESSSTMFIVEDGKVFLFASADRRDTWNRDRHGSLEQASAQWERVRASLAAGLTERDQTAIAACEQLYRAQGRQRGTRLP